MLFPSHSWGSRWCPEKLDNFLRVTQLISDEDSLICVQCLAHDMGLQLAWRHLVPPHLLVLLSAVALLTHCESLKGVLPMRFNEIEK